MEGGKKQGSKEGQTQKIHGSAKTKIYRKIEAYALSDIGSNQLLASYIGRGKQR